MLLLLFSAFGFMFFLLLHARYCLLSAPAFQNVKVNTPPSFEW